MAAGGAGLALDVGGGQHVLSQDEAAQARREGLEAAEHAVGELPARGVGPAPLQMIGRVLHDDGHDVARVLHRSEEHTSELQSLMRISYAVFCWKKKKQNITNR